MNFLSKRIMNSISKRTMNSLSNRFMNVLFKRIMHFLLNRFMKFLFICEEILGPPGGRASGRPGVGGCGGAEPPHPVRGSP